MSQENVDVVRRIYDAAARRDDSTPFEFYAEEIVWDLTNTRRAVLFTQAVYHGHGGVRQAWRETLGAFGEVDFDVTELIAAGDQVVATLRERVVGRASGAPAETTHAAVWTLADGKVTRLEVFDNPRQALESAGLSE